MSTSVTEQCELWSDLNVTVMESDTSVTVQCKLWSDLNVTVME